MAAAATPDGMPWSGCCDGETLQIPQALASTKDSEHGNRQQIQGGKQTLRRIRASGIDLRLLIG